MMTCREFAERLLDYLSDELRRMKFSGSNSILTAAHPALPFSPRIASRSILPASFPVILCPRHVSSGCAPPSRSSGNSSTMFSGGSQNRRGATSQAVLRTAAKQIIGP